MEYKNKTKKDHRYREDLWLSEEGGSGGEMGEGGQKVKTNKKAKIKTPLILLFFLQNYYCLTLG